MNLLKDCECITHFPGGSIADTSTLCGFRGGERINLTETKARKVTCSACHEILENVRRFLILAPTQKGDAHGR